MDVNGKLSDGDLKKTEALHSNGQPVDDVIIIESEGDENKVVVETNIIEGPFEEHKEHRCDKTDNSAHEEASMSSDDDSDSDLYGFLRESENEQTSESDVEETDIEVCASNYVLKSMAGQLLTFNMFNFEIITSKSEKKVWSPCP
uniref:Uncharacterized protein n=1 Tax=Aegilops tauschii subsp. strangulata TaxID=200361 RepID=A0A452YC99_AEGTS